MYQILVLGLTPENAAVRSRPGRTGCEHWGRPFRYTSVFLSVESGRAAFQIFSATVCAQTIWLVDDSSNMQKCGCSDNLRKELSVVKWPAVERFLFSRRTPSGCAPTTERWHSSWHNPAGFKTSPLSFRRNSESVSRLLQFVFSTWLLCCSHVGLTLLKLTRVSFVSAGNGWTCWSAPRLATWSW